MRENFVSSRKYNRRSILQNFPSSNIDDERCPIESESTSTEIIIEIHDLLMDEGRSLDLLKT